MDYVLALRLVLPMRRWLIGCSAHLTLITANKNYQIPNMARKGFAASLNHLLIIFDFSPSTTGIDALPLVLFRITLGGTSF